MCECRNVHIRVLLMLNGIQDLIPLGERAHDLRLPDAIGRLLVLRLVEMLVSRNQRANIGIVQQRFRPLPVFLKESRGISLVECHSSLGNESRRVQ